MSCVLGESSSNSAACNHSLYHHKGQYTFRAGKGVGVERVREGTFMMIFETREWGVKVISLASSSSSGA